MFLGKILVIFSKTTLVLQSHIALLAYTDNIVLPTKTAITYSGVHNIWDEVCLKILRKPSLVQK